MSKQEWKESGTELGHAFKNFGKTFVRSAQTTTDKVVDWADGVTKDENGEKIEKEPNSTVYSDGSWKEVGKGLGSGFAGIGKTMLHTVGIGTDEAGAPEDNVSGETAKKTDSEPGSGE